jgi:hypothetical protein
MNDMEFDKNKILTPITVDQFVDEQLGWGADKLMWLEDSVRKEKPQLVTLDKSAIDYPFIIGNSSWRYFYPAPEPTYAERQAEWVKENNVKIGTKVRFIKGFNYNEDGSNCCEHKDAKGIEGIVESITRMYVFVYIPAVCGWSVPFTALEVIKEPSYHPFMNAEEFKHYRDEWICYNGITFKHEGYTEEGIIVDQEIIDWNTAFEKYHFEKEVPFGIKEEV